MLMVKIMHHGTGKQMVAGSANTAGSINSTVSANTTAGFSIVSIQEMEQSEQRLVMV
jgi:hypothetical protein